MEREELKRAFREVLDEELGFFPAPIARRWEGGNLVFEPNSPELQAKELPINVFFKKIVMLRDRLRVLEAKLNADPDLLPGRKVELQSYVTRCYGSLTSFNFLFEDTEDRFVGQKSGD